MKERRQSTSADAAECNTKVLTGRKARRAGSGEDVEGQLENLKAATIMMVDDEPTTIDVLEMFLQGEGYENFISTTDSRQALPLLVERDPDVLLLDLMMPHIGGLEILREIRNSAALEHIPVIVLTSSTDAETKLEVLELGATDFLGKPVDPSELALRLRNTLAAKAYRDHLAYYDGLTGLPNRRLFIGRLSRALDRARAEATPCAVLQIGLDRFKQINEALGHAVGDALLKAVAERLDAHMRQSDSLSRTGGDEFSLFLPGLGADERAARIARRVLSDMSRPFEVAGKELFLTSSIGVTLFPDDGDEIEALLTNAASAMSHAKQRAQNDFQFYSEAFNAESREQLELDNQLRKALERGQLQLYYQPKLDLRTGRITGAEALMRWNHPERGLVPPLKFIPIAEESGLIGVLGTWALREACAQSAAWQKTHSRPIRVAVNVSAKQFATAALVETIQGILTETGLDPRNLVLELTESVIMQDPERAMETMHRIKQMGAKLSIDDFGTGYSSFGSLKRFPVDELKIDRSFVKGVPDDADGAAIVTAIIGMAHTLGMTVVAEGVETEEQLAFLEERGCEEYQGFLFSRPVPAAEWDALFEAECKKG